MELFVRRHGEHWSSDTETVVSSVRFPMAIIDNRSLTTTLRALKLMLLLQCLVGCRVKGPQKSHSLRRRSKRKCPACRV